jgi:hypothetical protein
MRRIRRRGWLTRQTAGKDDRQRRCVVRCFLARAGPEVREMVWRGHLLRWLRLSRRRHRMSLELERSGIVRSRRPAIREIGRTAVPAIGPGAAPDIARAAVREIGRAAVRELGPGPVPGIRQRVDRPVHPRASVGRRTLAIDVAGMCASNRHWAGGLRGAWPRICVITGSIRLGTSRRPGSSIRLGTCRRPGSSIRLGTCRIGETIVRPQACRIPGHHRHLVVEACERWLSGRGLRIQQAWWWARCHGPVCRLIGQPCAGRRRGWRIRMLDAGLRGLRRPGLEGLRGAGLEGLRGTGSGR